MKMFPVAVVTTAVLLGVSLVQPVSAAGPAQESPFQEQGIPTHKHVLGYQDSKTGAFQPALVNVPEAVVAPIAGTMTITLHITLKTAVAAGYKVGCYADVSAIYSAAAGTTDYSELSYAYATVSGSTATCVISIPHSWQFPAPVTGDVEELVGTYTAAIVNPAATTTALLPLARESSGHFVSLAGANIFASAPSTYSVNVTL